MLTNVMEKKVIKNKKERLLELIKDLAFLQDVNIKLSAGGESDFYIDGKKVTLNPEGIYLLSECIFEILEEDIKNKEITAIGGLTLGADPIVTGVALISYLKKFPIKACIVRKEPKKHGKQLWVEGDINKNDKVVIVDDVTTTGRSVFEAIRVIEDIGCTVKKVISMVDREAGASNNFAEKGYSFESIFTKKDLL